MQLGHDNQTVLEAHSEFILECVAERLLKIVELGERVFSMTAEELVQEGVRDPVRIFIKVEPHKLKKMLEEKYRLISGVSLVDQLVERLLFSRQNEAEIENWTTCPSRPGIGLNDDGLLVMADHFRKELKINSIMETDVSGWDWSVQYWEQRADAEARRRLAGAEKNSCFAHCLQVQAYAVSCSVLVVPGGEMMSQRNLGVQLSGSYGTSPGNSRMRVIVSLVGKQIAAEPLGDSIGVSAMGDDSTERHWEGAQAVLERLGHRVKFVKSNTKLEGISFCSHEWMENGLAIPETAIKTVFRFLSNPPNLDDYPERYAQLAWTLRHHPDRLRLLEVSRRRLNLLIVSRL